MSTIPQELQTIVQRDIKGSYTNSVVDNYYNPTTMLPITPTNTSNPDRLMQLIVETALTIRSQTQYGNGVALTLGQKQELYQDIIDSLTEASDALGDVITTLTASKAALT